MQIVGIVRAALGLWDDVVNGVIVWPDLQGRGPAIAKALLAEVAVTLQDHKPQLVPIGAVPSFVPRSVIAAPACMIAAAVV